MDKKATVLLIIGTSLLQFIYALTTPVINVYFFSRVSAEILAVANLINIGMAAIVNASVSYDRLMDIYRKWFFAIVVVDVICFCCISFLSPEHVIVRFIGFALLNAVSTNLWCIVIRDCINRHISGESLTKWNSKYEAFTLSASFAGGIFAIAFVNLDIELCIAMQCFANIVMGCTDLSAYRRL